MTFSQFLLIILCVFGISAGQILFKLAALDLPKSGGILTVLSSLALNLYLLAGLTIYMGATVLWIWMLREVPLNLAYPVMALAFLFVPLLGALILGEPLQRATLTGGVMIILGVYIIVR